MNTPVTYNVATPAPMANTAVALQEPEKKESGVFGWLGGLFGSSTPSTNAAPAAVGGHRQRSRKAKRVNSRSRKAKRVNSRK